MKAPGAWRRIERGSGRTSGARPARRVSIGLGYRMRCFGRSPDRRWWLVVRRWSCRCRPAGDRLHINDGVYGSLSDAGAAGFNDPVRLIRPSGPKPSQDEAVFSFFGPACDSADVMRGLFILSADAGQEHWIEIGQLGVCGTSLGTSFNRFDRARLIEVRDPPLLAADCVEPGIRRAARAAGGARARASNQDEIPGL